MEYPRRYGACWVGGLEKSELEYSPVQVGFALVVRQQISRLMCVCVEISDNALRVLVQPINWIFVLL